MKELATKYMAFYERYEPFFTGALIILLAISILI